VQQHDVARPDPLEQLHRVGAQNPPIVISLRVAESRPVTVTVDAVVQPLGDREELCVAVDDQPPDRYAEIVHVPHERMQHFGDATTYGGGVHVPHRPAGEASAEALCGRLQPRIPFRSNHRRQPLDGSTAGRHQVHQTHVMCLPDAADVNTGAYPLYTRRNFSYQGAEQIVQGSPFRGDTLAQSQHGRCDVGGPRRYRLRERPDRKQWTAVRRSLVKGRLDRPAAGRGKDGRRPPVPV
jgi:hypothetical protein